MTENKPLIIPSWSRSTPTLARARKTSSSSWPPPWPARAGPPAPTAWPPTPRSASPPPPTGIPGGIAIPHCRSSHVLAPSLGFARLSQPVDFGAADGQAADLIFMIAAPDGADDFHLQLLAKLARGLMQSEFTDALRQAADAEEIARIVTRQVQPELLDDGAQARTARTGSR